jgi:hypothetical protein
MLQHKDLSEKERTVIKNRINALKCRNRKKAEMLDYKDQITALKAKY